METKMNVHPGDPLQAVRWDLTGARLIAIDPVCSQFRDDAIACIPDGDGWEVIVAVSDVAARIPQGSIVDEEARERGCATFSGDGTCANEMIPQALASEVCSLEPGQRRLALAVNARVARDGRIIGKPVIRPATVRVEQGLSYEKADDAIAKAGADRSGCRDMVRCASALRTARSGQALLVTDEPMDTYRAVEEMMVLAGTASAAELSSDAMPGTVFRHQGEPEEEMWQWFCSVVGAGATADREQRRAIVRNTIGRRQSEDWRQRREAVLAMRIAGAAGYTVNPDRAAHWTMGLDRYVTVTSPIRRYVDVLNQRALHARWGATVPNGVNEDDCRRFEERTREAKRRERAAMRVRIGGQIATRYGTEHEGMIVWAETYGIFVELPGIESMHVMVHASSLKAGRSYLSDGPARTLSDEWGLEQWHVGEKVRVRIGEPEPGSDRIPAQVTWHECEPERHEE